VIAAEVVEDDETALPHVLLQVVHFFVVHRPEAWFRNVQKWRGEEVGIVLREHIARRQVGIDQRDLFEDAREVALSARVIVRPGRFPTPLEAVTE
jgi:hypothetical protein